MSFEESMEHVVQGFETLGVVVLIAGAAIALIGYGLQVVRGRPRLAYEEARQVVGRAILLGLEVLIIADIVQTITIDPTLENAAALGVLVLVRTFLSFSIEVELDGSLPWRKAGPTKARSATDEGGGPTAAG
jgi:uncharacterized membrane protein